MSLDFSIDLILPVALWPWRSTQPQQKWVPEIFLGVKGGRRVRLTSPPSVSRLSRENVGAFTSHNPMDLHGLLQELFITLREVRLLIFGLHNSFHHSIYRYFSNTLNSTYATCSTLNILYKRTQLQILGKWRMHTKLRWNGQRYLYSYIYMNYLLFLKYLTLQLHCPWTVIAHYRRHLD
jgi:hypothetical protein